jgi:hypothetical protein
MPLYCRTGVHGYRASRRAWVDQEIGRIVQERNVKVRQTQYLDRQVLFYCSAEEFQDAPVSGDSLGDFSEAHIQFDQSLTAS